MIIKKLDDFKDQRGDLTPLEFSNLPFLPQRLFVVKNCKRGIRRGEHAHHETKQLLICLKGIIQVVTHDGKKYDKSILTEGYSTLIEPYNWDYQEFMTENDVLLVLCSTPFNLDDYILDFSEFIQIIKDRKDVKNRSKK